MSKIPELDQFIRDSVSEGKSHNEIETILIEAGWEKSQIKSAIDYYYDSSFPVAIPKPKPFASPKLFFLNLFYFLLIYIVIYNAVSILFTLLDYYLPDGLGRYGRGFYYSSSIKNGIQDNLAILIVCTPILYFTSHLLEKAISKTKQSIPRIRLILLYFTMFVGACTLLTSASCFVYFLLKGELSIRFIIKILILAITVSGVYFYYRTELNRDEQNA